MKSLTDEMIHTLVDVRVAHWCGLLAVIALFFAGLTPLVQRGNVLEKELRLVDQDMKRAEKAVAHPQEFEASFEEKSAQLEKLRAYTLQKGDQRRVISLITNITREAEITILEIQPIESEQEESEPAPDPEPVRPVLFSMHLEAPYQSLDYLFKHLREAALLIRVERFEMEPIAVRPGWIRVLMTIAAYEDKS